MKRAYYFLFIVILSSNSLISKPLHWSLCDSLNNNNVFSISLINNKIFAGTESGSFYCVSDSDILDNWTFCNSNLADSFYYSLAITEFNNKIFVGTLYGIYISSDTGKSWYRYDNDLKRVDNIFIYKNNLYAHSNFYNLYVSTDEGISWTEIQSNVSKFYKFAVKGDTIFCGAIGGLYYSVDSGKTYTRILYVDGYIQHLFVTENKIYFSNNDSGSEEMYVSADNGINWVITHFESTITGIKEQYNKIIEVSTFGNGILCSFDNGITWNKINVFLPNLNIYTLTGKNGRNDTLYCSPAGKGIYEMDWGGYDVQDSPENNKQLVVCPNPVSDILTISNLPNDFNYNTNIEIYNIYGLKVIEIPYMDKIDVSKLNAGVYYLKINNQFTKFVKI